MLEIRVVLAWLSAQRRALLAKAQPDNDRGDIVQTVIIVSLFAAAAIVIVGILVAKATTAANNVKTQ
jgi:hypothetical protein